MNKAQSFVLALLFFTFNLSAQTIVKVNGSITNNYSKKIQIKFILDDGSTTVIDSVDTDANGYYFKELSIITDSTRLVVTTSIVNCNYVTVVDTKNIVVRVGDTKFSYQKLKYCNIIDTLFVNGNIDSLNGNPTSVNIYYLASNLKKTTDSIQVHTNSIGDYNGKFLLADTLGITNGKVVTKFLNCKNQIIADTTTFSLSPITGSTIRADRVVLNLTSCTIKTPKTCSAKFTVAQAIDNKGPIPYSIVIYENSIGDSLNYKWLFGDGDSATRQTPKHSYSTNGPYNLCLVVSNNTCIDTFCQTISIDSSGMMNKKEGFTIIIIHAIEPNSIEPQEKTIQLNIYPNPSHNNINLSFNSYTNGNAQFIIYDISGRIVKQINTATLAGTNKINVETSELAKGIYNLQLKTENWTATSIFIKK